MITARPSWQDKKYGSKIRAALWLEAEVGEGNIFTKTQLRQAFPDDTQIDRRVRELRSHGWRIDTSRDDPGLRQEEQRYVSRGAEVWVPGQAKPADSRGTLTSSQRIKVWEADNFLCRTCGIGAGESYGEGVERSKLNVTRRKVRQANGEIASELVTECNRCASGGGGRMVNVGEVLAAVEGLTPLERRVLRGWMEADRRSVTALEQLWGVYRTLPVESRQLMRHAVVSADS